MSLGVLFPKPTSVPARQLSQQTSTGEAGIDRHLQLFQVGSWLVAEFDAIFYVGEVHSGLQSGTARVKYTVVYRCTARVKYTVVYIVAQLE